MPGPGPSIGAGTWYGWGPYGVDNVVDDVSEIIYTITPDDTPFYNMTGDVTSTSVLHEWQTRDLTTRQVNAQQEGFSFTFTSAGRFPGRVVNTCQIFGEEIRVSRTNQRIQHHAIGDLFADQMMVKMIELKTHMEHAFLRGSMATGATNGARYMAGLINAVTSLQSTYTTLAGSSSVTEASFNAFLNTLWDVGAEPRDVLVAGLAKRRISAYTTGGTRYIAADEQRQVNTISVYESDFFPLTIHLSRDIPSDAGSGGDALFVDRTMAKKAWIDTPKSEVVPKTADSRDGIIYSEGALEWGNARAHGYIRWGFF